MLHKLNSKLIAAALLSITTFATPALSETVLRYADHGANRGARAGNAEWFMNEIGKRTNGNVKVELHWAGALLGAKAMLEGLNSNVASIGTLIGSYFPKEFTAYRVGNLAIENPDEVAGAISMHELATTNKDLIAEFDRQEIKYLASYTVGPIQMICNGDPITKLEDFKGKKIRYAGDYGKILADYGAIPVALSVTKAYQALDTGLIDCSQTYGYLTTAFKLYEVANQYVIFNAGTLQSNGIFMNKEAFEALAPADQKIIEEIGAEMTERNARAIRDANHAAINKLEAGIDGHKVNVSYLSDDARKSLDDASGKYVAEWIAEAKKRGFDGASVLAEFQALIAKNLKIYAK